MEVAQSHAAYPLLHGLSRYALRVTSKLATSQGNSAVQDRINTDHDNMTKTAIVSGGARGIGRCIVRRFLERGYKVYIFDIDEDELKHTTQTHLKQYTNGKYLSTSICNLRDVGDIRKKVEEAVRFLGGRIDVLVNNGGIASPKWKDGKTMFDQQTIEEWQA